MLDCLDTDDLIVLHVHTQGVTQQAVGLSSRQLVKYLSLEPREAAEL